MWCKTWLWTWCIVILGTLWFVTHCLENSYVISYIFYLKLGNYAGEKAMYSLTAVICIGCCSSQLFIDLHLGGWDQDICSTNCKFWVVCWCYRDNSIDSFSSVEHVCIIPPPPPPISPLWYAPPCKWGGNAIIQCSNGQLSFDVIWIEIRVTACSLKVCSVWQWCYGEAFL